MSIYDEVEYGVDDFDSIGDRYIDEYDDDYDYIEPESLDLVAIAYRYGDTE